MKIRGKIDSLAAVKTDLGGINVTMETIGLDKNEAGLVIGKNGATIKFFSDKFNVGIDVNDIKDEVATVAVVGNYGNVAGAVEAIKLLIYQNKDIVLNVVVSNLVRHKFLQDSGKMVKDVQKEVNESIGGNAVRLIFEKNGSESSSVSLLEIKSPRMHHLSAVELVKKRIADYESDALFIKIEPYMIAKFVGKGGKNIKELKKLGTGVVIEVDGVVGEVSVLTNDEATKELIRAAIEKFIAENQILKIPVDVSMMGMVSRRCAV
jgi:polyribonucleotide nucleotidyltransferase